MRAEAESIGEERPEPPQRLIADADIHVADERRPTARTLAASCFHRHSELLAKGRTNFVTLKERNRSSRVQPAGAKRLARSARTSLPVRGATGNYLAGGGLTPFRQLELCRMNHRRDHVSGRARANPPAPSDLLALQGRGHPVTIGSTALGVIRCAPDERSANATRCCHGCDRPRRVGGRSDLSDGRGEVPAFDLGRAARRYWAPLRARHRCADRWRGAGRGRRAARLQNRAPGKRASQAAYAMRTSWLRSGARRPPDSSTARPRRRTELGRSLVWKWPQPFEPAAAACSLRVWRDSRRRRGGRCSLGFG